jgi:tRNA(His) 5'-end guanylyltransferase
MPVIIRLDGKAFHTFTRGFEKPFDGVLSNTMQKTMEYLCKNVEGCVLGYTQSDEISLLLVDYKNLNTEAWFNYAVQKCVSIVASMATFAFNKYFPQIIREHLGEFFEDIDSDEDEKYLDVLDKAMERGAMFDARIFNIPKEEVVNYFVWRQNDCIRNAVNSIGQKYFSNKVLLHKSTADIKNMLSDNGISVDSYDEKYMNGLICMKKDSWKFDTFQFKQNRKCVEGLFMFEN